MKDPIEVILTRQSVRQFTGAPVKKEDLDLIIKAAFAAPSAVNIQPWAFLAVTDRAILDRLCAELPYAKMLDKAGAALIVCGNPHKDEQIAPRFWPVDCSAATQNILLAVHALGYGTVWTAVHPDEARIQSVRDICRIPEGFIPFNVIPIGVPAQAPGAPKDKYKAELVHWNTW